MSYILDVLEEQVALLCYEKLWIWNWRTGALLAEVTQTLDDEITNISFIAPGYILVVRPAAGLDGLQLCSFPLEPPSNPSDHPLVSRVIYQFPSFSGTSVLSDVRIQADRQTFLRPPKSSDTPKEAPLRPFHLSSRSRVFSLELVLTELLHGVTKYANFVIFVIAPTFMKYVNPSQPAREPRVVLGKDWLYDTRVFTGVNTHRVEEHQIAGSRVVFSTTNHQRDEVRLEVIDFNPEIAARTAGIPQEQWSAYGAVPVEGPDETEITAMFGRGLIQDDFADPVVCAMPYTVSVRTVKVDPDEWIYREVCIDEERLVILKVSPLTIIRSRADSGPMVASKHP
jgi:hypothetical protein